MIRLWLLFVCALLVAQENPYLKFEGKVYRKPNEDDLKLLGVLARGLMYEAGKKGGMSDNAKALAAATTEAFAEQDSLKAWRLVTRLNTLLLGEEPSEESDVAAAVDFDLEKRILTSSSTQRTTIYPLFTPAEKLKNQYVFRISVRSETGDFKSAFNPTEFDTLLDRSGRLQLDNRKPGRYFVDFELSTKAGKKLTQVTRDFIVVPDIKQRLRVLRSKLDKLEEKKETDIRRLAALQSALYIADLLEKATWEYVADTNKAAHPIVAKQRGARLTGYTSDVFRLPQDLEFAEELATALDSGKSPLVSHTGDMRLAHRSAVDNKLQPFRVYVPRSFDATRKYPLLIALHGATGDENTYMDRYVTAGKNVFQEQADARGYIVATPFGRGAFGMYLGDSETDVLEVIDRVTAIYPIQTGEVFLTGHSMGGGGTWHIGFGNSQRFRALAPVASGFGGRIPGTPSVSLNKAPGMPVLFSYGMKDTLATPESSKRIIEHAKKELANFESREYPDDHFVIGVTSMSAVFDFFDRFRAKR